MPRTILSVAYPFAPVSSQTAGGAEQILLSIDSFLHRSGYRSLVVCCKGSRASGTIIELDAPDGVIDDLTRFSMWKNYRLLIESVVKEYRVDLVHFHGLDFDKYLPDLSVPVLVTLHLPLSWYSPQVLLQERSAVFFNCVSRHQFLTRDQTLNLVGVVENGVELPSGINPNNRGKYAVAMGRICPEKNFHSAFDAARMAGIPLLLAGKVFPYREHLDYFASHIAPRLNNRYRFIGMIDSSQRKKILQHAHCTLITSRAPETSSLVAMESLAAGTPVIAFGSGALPSIVENGKTGFIVENVQEMADAVNQITDIDRNWCRRVAEERFSAERMGLQYLEIYRSLIETSSRNFKEAG